MILIHRIRMVEVDKIALLNVLFCSCTWDCRWSAALPNLCTVLRSFIRLFQLTTGEAAPRWNRGSAESTPVRRVDGPGAWSIVRSDRRWVDHSLPQPRHLAAHRSGVWSASWVVSQSTPVSRSFGCEGRKEGRTRPTAQTRTHALVTTMTLARQRCASRSQRGRRSSVCRPFGRSPDVIEALRNQPHASDSVAGPSALPETAYRD